MVRWRMVCPHPSMARGLPCHLLPSCPIPPACTCLHLLAPACICWVSPPMRPPSPRRWVRTTATTAQCPLCERPATHVHSRYTRQLADLPWHGVAMRLVLHVRKFFCETTACPRRVFTERLPGGVAPYARRTLRLEDWFVVVGFAAGGTAGGARVLCRRWGSQPPPRSSWRVCAPIASPSARRRACWAWMISPFAVGGATARSWSTWSATGRWTCCPTAPPRRWRVGSKRIPAARSSHATAAGITRWGRARGRARGRPTRSKWPTGSISSRIWASWSSACCAATPQPCSGSQRSPLRQTPLPARPPSRRGPSAKRRAQVQAKIRHRYEAIHALAATGLGRQAIADALGLNPQTVARTLRLPTCPQRMRHPRQRNILDPYEPDRRERYQQGERNGLDLWRKIVARGYPGTSRNVSRLLTYWRQPELYTGAGGTSHPGRAWAGRTRGADGELATTGPDPARGGGAALPPARRPDR